MPVEPPKLDRVKALREQKEKHWMTHLVHRITGLMNADERLGEPIRENDRIVLPILNLGEHAARPDEDPVSLHALMEAWLDDYTP